MELQRIFNEIKEIVDLRLLEFERIRRYGTDEEIFEELCFCILTPQSKARMAEKVIENLKRKDLIYKSNYEKIVDELNLVRFKYHKAKYLCELQEKFVVGGKPVIKEALERFSDVYLKRKWLVENVKGIGMKEASHFLRNIGFYKDVAILDRHVIRNLLKYGKLSKVYNLSVKNYSYIESIMKNWAEELKIPFEYLDFVLWYKETGDIFK